MSVFIGFSGAPTGTSPGGSITISSGQIVGRSPTETGSGAASGKTLGNGIGWSGGQVVATTQMSVTADASGIRLVGDASTPGGSKYYGTDAGGNRGFWALPSGSGATISIGTVTTGAAGSSASVTNSGTSSAAVFNFTIPRGDTGPAGATGATGAAATVTIGTVSTGAAGSSASVTNSGTSSAAVFNFTIPRGETGPAGATGAAGASATVTIGTVSTGAAGSSASVTNSGTSSAAVFNFTIPRGDTGPAGATGATGAAATVSIGTVSTGAAGSSASVTNSGTSSAAVFNFTIPRGDTGPAGATGATGAAATVSIGTVTTGAAGSSASVTNSGTSTAAVLNFTIPRGADGTGSGAGGDPILTFRASQLIPATTNGAGVDSQETTTGGSVNRDYLTFPAGVNRYAWLELAVPTGWNSGFEYRLIWRSLAVSGTVQWEVAARAYSDGNDETSAAGSGAIVADGAAGYGSATMISDWSTAVPVAGAVLDGNPMMIRIGRLGASTAPLDNLSNTAFLHMVQIRKASAS